MPRLERLKQELLEIDLQLIVSTEFPVLKSGRVDFAFAPDYKRALDAQSLSSTPLYCECMTLVCSPTLLEGENPVSRPQDISADLILGTHSMKLEWQKWLKAAETPDVELAPDMAFETSLDALHAARDGLGFALGERLSVHQRILAGSLVAPFTEIVVTGHNVKLFRRK